MQARSRLSGVVASIALALTLAACGGSTDPRPLPATQLATHFDSIFSVRLAAGTAADSEAAFAVGQFVELAPAYGANDTAITVTTASGTQMWRGLSFALIDVNGDSDAFFALYPNRNLSRVVLVQIVRSGGWVSATSIGTTDQFTTVYPDSVASGTSTLLSTGATCSLQSRLAIDPTFSQEYSGYSCASAQINGSLSVVFRAATNIGSVAISNVTFGGVLLTEAGASHVVGIPSRGAAAAFGLKSLFDYRR
ncbi:MAG TPA: hypothetical protein VNW46_13835 [Gemmatimonadaceae bacterium]|jgi:hypothetical protein|nr:hypothetical protein [Gemmatimonadaceae bacterium]